MKIAVIGAGVMGEPIAKNLRKAGLAVTAYCRTQERSESLLKAGVMVARTVAEAINASNVILLMVPGHQEIDQVLGRGSDGSVTACIDGKTVILMSTVAPSYSLALGGDVVRAGARYVEAPVSGSRAPAETAQLVVLASAALDADIDEVQAVFDAIAKRTVRCGVVPTAMRMKLANNLLLIATFEALCEATHFAQGVGLDVHQFFDVVLCGPLANDVLRMKAAKLLADDFGQQAPIRHVAKDIGLVCDEAALRNVWLPIARANRDLYADAMRSGLANDDAIGIIKMLRNGETR